MVKLIELRLVRRTLAILFRFVRPHQLQTLFLGVFIVVIVLILTGPASRQKPIQKPSVQIIPKHHIGISDKEEYLTTISAPHQILLSCRSRQLETLFFVHTSPDRFDDRQELRDYLHRPPEMDIVFMLGTSENETVALQIAEEAAEHEDIIIFRTFIDSYRNLTLKFVHAIRWIHKQCGMVPSLKYIVKLDDDVWVNLPMLRAYLKYGIPKQPDRIHCLVWRRVRVARRLTSKWFVSKDEYPAPYYPPYCGGLAYIIPKKLLHLLVEASHNVPFFWVDDVYATGLLARHVHIGHAQISSYYAFSINDTAADFAAPWRETMQMAFGSMRILFAHMNTQPLRNLRKYLFSTIDETLLNYSNFKVF